jgi:hypothetical protein
MIKIFSISLLITAISSTIVSTNVIGSAYGDLQFIPESLQYGSTLVEKCVPKRICAVNNTNQSISDPSFRVVEKGNFSVQQKFQKCPNPLPPGEACIVYVDFCPEFVRKYQGTLLFSGSGTESNIVMEGKGSSAPP